MNTRQPLFDSAIQDFLDGGLPNAWIDILDTQTNERVGEIYVRKGKRVIEGERVMTLDLANIQIEPDKVGQGIFTRWLNRIEFCLKFQSEIAAVYIEIVVNERFANFLEQREYTEEPGRTHLDTYPSYYQKVRYVPTNEFVKKICYIGQGSETCRYLMRGVGGWGCAKLHSGLSAQINDRVEHMSAQADNCSGLLVSDN